MGHTRVILTRLPPLLADLIAQLLVDGTDVHAATSTDVAGLIDEAKQLRAAVVIVGTDCDSSQRIELSAALRGVVVAVIDARGVTGARYVDGHLELKCEDLSADALQTLLRAPGG
jgi:hypothetical protein